MKTPALTLGLPVYNGEGLIGKAMESLLAQSFTDYELIICDNHSTDSTADICQYYADHDARVIYHRNERNIGAAANFNKVLTLASGQYFAWANHDDLWAASYFEECMSLLTAHPTATLAYTRAFHVNIETEKRTLLLHNLGLDASRPRERLKRFHQLLSSLENVERKGLWIPIYGVIRRSILEQTGRIGSYIGSDTVLLEELVMCGQFLEISKPLFFKCDHPGRSMRANVTFDKRIEWFSGKPSSRLLLPHWRALRERLLATHRSNLLWRDKAGCYAEMLGFHLANRRAARSLSNELWINVRRAIGSKISAGKLPGTWW